MTFCKQTWRRDVFRICCNIGWCTASSEVHKSQFVENLVQINGRRLCRNSKFKPRHVNSREWHGQRSAKGFAQWKAKSKVKVTHCTGMRHGLWSLVVDVSWESAVHRHCHLNSDEEESCDAADTEPTLCHAVSVGAETDAKDSHERGISVVLHTPYQLYVFDSFVPINVYKCPLSETIRHCFIWVFQRPTGGDEQRCQCTV